MWDLEKNKILAPLTTAAAAAAAAMGLYAVRGMATKTSARTQNKQTNMKENFISIKHYESSGKSACITQSKK